MVICITHASAPFGRKKLKWEIKHVGLNNIRKFADIAPKVIAPPNKSIDLGGIANPSITHYSKWG